MNIRCRDAALLVCDARDRTLSPREERSLRDHLAGCDSCSKASAQFGQLFEQLDELLARQQTTAVDGDASPGVA